MHGKSEISQHDIPGEIVVHHDETAKKAHQQLFSLPDSAYRPTRGKITDAIAAAARDNIIKLHIAADWETILAIALWSSVRPSSHDVHTLLRKLGVPGDELAPFAKADIGDLFPWLYYGKKFDLLRKICNSAKARTESMIEKKKVLVYCHMVSPDPQAIIASSL